MGREIKNGRAMLEGMKRKEAKAKKNPTKHLQNRERWRLIILKSPHQMLLPTTATIGTDAATANPSLFAPRHHLKAASDRWSTSHSRFLIQIYSSFSTPSPPRSLPSPCFSRSLTSCCSWWRKRLGIGDLGFFIFSAWLISYVACLITFKENRNEKK